MGDSTVVLASDSPQDVQAFYAKKLDLTPEPALATDAGGNKKPPAKVEQAVESASDKPSAKPAAEEEGDIQQIQNPETRSKVHVRFSELTEQRKAAEAKALEAETKAADAVKARALAEQETARLRAQYEPPKDPVGPEPQRKDFVNDAEWGQALKEHTTEKVLQENQAKEQKQRDVEAWKAKETAAKADLADYETVIAAGANLMLSDQVRDALVDSPIGPKILYELAKDPAFVADLAKMTAGRAVREIGKLEARLEAKAPTKPATEVAKPAAVAEISRAPAPITPLRGTESIEASVGDTVATVGNGMTAAQWRALRKAGKV